jgi:hypothetical protein
MKNIVRFRFWFLILGLASIFSFDSQIQLANASVFPFESDRIVLISEMQSSNVPSKIVDLVRQDILKRDRTEAERLKVMEATQKTWQDGCLGLAKPDEICTQALVEGWKIVVSDGEKSWTYRTDETGNSLRLETEKTARN